MKSCDFSIFITFIIQIKISIRIQITIFTYDLINLSVPNFPNPFQSKQIRPRYVIVQVAILINLLLLFVGMFMETIAALIVLFVPLLALAQSVGIDPLHFATFAVLNLMIGLTTPPVGVCLFVCAGIAKLPLAKVVRAIAPFLICNIMVLLLVSYVPAFSTWLPSLLFD